MRTFSVTLSIVFSLLLTAQLHAKPMTTGQACTQKDACGVAATCAQGSCCMSCPAVTGTVSSCQCVIGCKCGGDSLSQIRISGDAEGYLILPADVSVKCPEGYKQETSGKGIICKK